MAQDQRSALKAADAIDDGWQGTEPPQGSRRQLIRDAVREVDGVCPGPGGPAAAALRIADAVESALLQATIAKESRIECTDAPPSMATVERELKERAEELLEEKREEAADAHRLLDELGVARGPEIPNPTVYNRLRALQEAPKAYLSGRDDEWAQRLAMEAMVAAHESDVPFPASELNVLLREFGVEPKLPRRWPARGHTIAYDVEKDKGLDDADDADEDALAWGRRMLEEREQARSGESRFCEERDCAYALLRWLLPVRVATRIDDEDDD